MKGQPRRKPGHDRLGPCHRPQPGNHSLAGSGFRASGYSVRPQSNYAYGRRQVEGSCGPRAVDTGCEWGLRQESQLCVYTRKSPLLRGTGAPAASISLGPSVRSHLVRSFLRSPSLSRGIPEGGEYPSRRARAVRAPENTAFLARARVSRNAHRAGGGSA